MSNLSPQEKATELVDKFYEIENASGLYNITTAEAVKCAIIHVEGIIEIIKYHGTDIGKHSLLFYKEVKQEIEKL